MTSVDIQRAFNSESKAVCTKATLGYHNGTHQVLTLDGRHDSGEPFSITSEPFLGDPIEQARELARNLKIGLSVMGAIDRELTKEVEIQNGRAMSTDVKALTNEIGNALSKIKARARQAQDNIKATTASLEVTLDKAEAFDRELKAADAELNAMLAPEGNGGPE